jgi:hypothetical protein
MLAPVWWFSNIVSFLVPIFYCIWPPTVPERGDLIQRDPKNLVITTKPKAVQHRQGVLITLQGVQRALIFCYVTAVFIGTFIY